ncbi:MAG: hypothetical protein AAF928_17220, partial [Myxococcota bacterium]
MHRIRGDPDGRRHSDLSRANLDPPRERLDDALRGGHDVPRAGILQKDGELVATEASYGICLAHRRSKPLGYDTEQLVPRFVA